MERLFYNFVNFFFTLTYVSLDEKFLFTKKTFFPESYSSPYSILQSVFHKNMRNIK